MTVFLLILLAKITYSCFPTSPGTGVDTGCCPGLEQNVVPQTPDFQNGDMVFSYDNTGCPLIAVATCSRGNLTGDFTAAIRINDVFFLATDTNAVSSIPFACNRLTRQWVVAEPPPNPSPTLAVIDNIECLLSPI